MFANDLASVEAISRTGLVHRVHLPASGKADITLLLVHGRAGNAEVPWTFARAFRHSDPLIVSAQAPFADPIGGYSWWQVESESPNNPDAPRPATKPDQLVPALEKLEFFIRAVPQTYHVKSKHLIAIGFSQGAAMVSSLSLKAPELFSGVAMLAGFIPKFIFPEGQFIAGYHPQTRASLPRYFIAHGSMDTVVPIDRAEKASNALASLGADVTFHQENVQHKVGTQGMRALTEWAQSFEEESLR